MVRKIPHGMNTDIRLYMRRAQKWMRREIWKDKCCAYFAKIPVRGTSVA